MSADQLDDYFADLRPSGLIEARGVEFDADLLGRVRAEMLLRQAEAGVAVSFQDARFSTDVDFRRITFDESDFSGAVFEQRTLFTSATFRKVGDFDEAEFRTIVDFSEATFEQSARFYEASFDGMAFFSECRFEQDAVFSLCNFASDAWFSGAVFEGDTIFFSPVFHRRVWLGHAVFRSSRRLGPIVAREKMILNGTEFLARSRCQLIAPRIDLSAAQFPQGVTLEVGRGDVNLESVSLAAGSRVAPVRVLPNRVLHDEGLLTWVRQRNAAIVSFRKAHLTDVEVANLDLRPCRFSGAVGLNRLRLGAGVILAHTPSAWWRTSRATIAEEHDWRANGHPTAQSPWDVPAVDAPPEVRNVEVLDPAEIAEIYRGLRLARESLGDDPGAADFYYGEMDMRRHDTYSNRGARSGTVRSIGESFLLSAYWALSGYSLRASRALVALLIVIVTSGIGLTLIGTGDERPLSPEEKRRLEVLVDDVFAGSAVDINVAANQSKPDLIEAVVIASEMTLAPFSTVDVELSLSGRAIRLIDRLLGPALVALALLSVRGRVKR